MPETIQTLAQQMSKAFETRERSNGENFRALKDGSPEWMTEVCHAAHGDMMPDDWRYRFIEEAVDAIAECDEDDDPSEAVDTIEASIYTSELTGWLHSRVDRVFFIDEAISEYGEPKDGCSLLAQAQQMEIRETFQQVLSALAEIVEAQEEAEDEGDDDKGPNPEGWNEIEA